VLCFLATGSLFSDDPDNIISEAKASIQFFSTAEFEDWPGVSGIAPVGISAAGGRTWLIWPGCIINLGENGRSDEFTLLSLFATRATPRGRRQWSPEGGTICSDGYWRAVRDTVFVQLDLFSGRMSERKWTADPPDSLYPAPGGKVLIFNRGKVRLADFNTDEVGRETEIPPVAILAVSAEKPLAAWKDGRNNNIHIAGFDGRYAGTHRVISPGEISLPGNPPLNMSWAGNLLVLGYPGKLYFLDHPEEQNPEVYLLRNEEIPQRWYRSTGGNNRMIIQVPDSGTAAIISPKDYPRIDNSDFPGILREFTLTAGDTLEKSGFPEQAEIYYGWILPHIRNMRSRYPLEEIWPNLEAEITRRRTALR